ncbi:MAG: hypothetical protein IH968_04855 [Gemmatimonadetes bacterium]|nr:hypothetical protein [Gemmatimonadota bacterium]
MRRIARVLSLLLALSGLSAPAVYGQERQQESGFTLGQNYPNPFNPTTRIPFELFEDLFVDGKTAVVSLRIYNILQQFVAAPTALNHSSGDGGPLINLEYVQPGRYEAYWDGRDVSGRQVASGIYFVQITVNGQINVMKMWVAK